jgi:polygalacturonase
MLAWFLAALASRALAARTCDVVAVCGARADNATNAAPFLSACVAAGGPCSAPNSTLLFPADAHFLSGSIDLSDTVNLTLSFSEGAALFGSGDPALFPLQPALPPTNMPQFAQQWAALIYARNVTGLTLEGPPSAVIDGLGWPWWRAFANGSLAHQRPKLVEVVDGQRVTFRGLTIRNSPFWTLHTLYSRDVQFLGLTITAPRSVGNTDGIDPNSCSDVVIADCVISVGDDGISLKSDFRVDPRTGDVTLLPTERVVSVSHPASENRPA